MPNVIVLKEGISFSEPAKSIFSRTTKSLLVKTTFGVASSLKVAATIIDFQNQLLKQGVSLVETIADNMAEICPETATTMNEITETLQQVVKKSEKKHVEIDVGMDKLEIETSDPGLIKKGVRVAFSSFPGKQLLQVFDLAISITEKSLDYMDISPHDKLSKDDKAQQTEPTDKSKSQESEEIKKQNVESSVDRDVESNKAVLPRKRGVLATIGAILVFPLRIVMTLWIRIMKPIQCYLHEATNVDKGTSTNSPLKRKRVAIRRNVTPQKTPVLRKIKDTIFNAVGLSKIKEEEVVRHEKRKHDDVACSEESDNEVNLDEILIEYDSDLDPDYSLTVDQSNASTDSLEYKSGDTESDIEIETKEVDGKLLEQIKVQEMIIDDKVNGNVEDEVLQNGNMENELLVKDQKNRELKENDENKSPIKKKTSKIPVEKKVIKADSPDKKSPKESTPAKNKNAKKDAQKIEDGILSPKNQSNTVDNFRLAPTWAKPKK